MEWLSSIFNSFFHLFPRITHITKDMRALIIRANKVKILTPGFYVYWPVIHDFRSCYVTRLDMDLPEQLLCSADGDTMLVSSSIVYKIVDIEKALLCTHDYESTVMEIAQKAIKDIIVSNVTWKILRNQEVNEDLIDAMGHELEDYGLCVDSVFFTSVAKTKNYHITGVYINASQA